MEIGITFASTSREYEKDPMHALDIIKAAGYDVMEFGRDSLDPTELRKELDARGIKPVSAHLLWDDFKEDKYEDTLAYATALGVDTIVLPWVPDEIICDYETTVNTAKELDKLAAKLKDRGFRLIYHNHWTEFVKIYEGKYVEDIFFENTSLLGFELDLGWAWAGGCDVVPYIKKLGSRLVYVHIKDVDKEDDRMPVELGTGRVDIKACMDAAAEVGAERGIVEQDAPSRVYSDEDSIRFNREALRKMGY